MKVSVVIPAYNAERTIGAVLDALASQDAPPDEVIVVDDGSKDETAAIAARSRRAGRRDRSTRGYAGGARNRGWDEATGDVVVFLDSDAIPAPGWGAGLRRALDEYPGAIVGCARTFDARTAVGLGRAPPGRDAVPPARRAARVRFLSSYCMAVPRERSAALGRELRRRGRPLLGRRASRPGFALVFDPRFHAFHDHARETLLELRGQQQRLAFGLARIGPCSARGSHKRIARPGAAALLRAAPAAGRSTGGSSTLPELRRASSGSCPGWSSRSGRSVRARFATRSARPAARGADGAGFR